MTDSNATRAAELHRQAIVIDGHSDILMAIAGQRMRLGDRFPLPDSKSWEAPLGWHEPPEAAMYDFSKHTSYFQTMGHYDLPRFREGGLTAQGMAIYIEAAELNRALETALEMVYWLDREFAEIEDFDPVLTAADIRRIKAEGKVGGILTFEGFEPLGANLHLLDIFHRLGLRMATLTHSRRNYFADGTQSGVKTTGLTEAGVAAVRRHERAGDRDRPGPSGSGRLHRGAGALRATGHLLARQSTPCRFGATLRATVPASPSAFMRGW